MTSHRTIKKTSILFFWRECLQLIGMGMVIWLLVTLPLQTNPTLLVFAIFNGLEITMYAMTTLKKPLAITTNSSAWVASLLLAVYPAITPHLIQFPVHSTKTLYGIGVDMEYLAVVIEIVALSRLRTSFSQVPEANRLITSGLYRFVRHPLYTAYVIGFGGFAITVNELMIWGAYLVFVVAEMIRAKAEERVLIQVFPEYEAYRQRTGMFLPKWGSLR